jgi:Transglutaminase-like superfamily
MVGWSLVLPILKYVLPLPTLVRLMSSRGAGARQHEREEQVVVLARGLSRVRPLPFRDNCLERSLLAYRFLSRANAEPSLVVGVRREEDSVVGHVWVTLDGEPVDETSSSLRGFAPVVTFGSGGTPRLSSRG